MCSGIMWQEIYLWGCLWDGNREPGGLEVGDFHQRVWWGAPTNIRSDNSQMKKSKSFLQIMKKYNIYSSTTDPHHPKNSSIERKKKSTRREKTPSLTELVLPAIYDCTPFCFGLGYLNVRPNLPMDTNLRI